MGGHKLLVFKMKRYIIVAAKGFYIFILGLTVLGIISIWMFYRNTNHQAQRYVIRAISNPAKLVTSRNVSSVIATTKKNRSARLNEIHKIKTNANHPGRIYVAGATNISTKLVTIRNVPPMIATTKKNRSAHLTESYKIKNLSSTNSKRFVYLVQAPQCLQPSLLTNDFFGNETLCQCDVIVLSYQNECSSSLLHHVEYVHYEHRTTWTQGKNLLWLQAKSRHKQYKYYIFMDDDIEIGYSKNKIPGFKREAISPLRAFEKFLLNYKPVVGVGDYLIHHDYRFMLEKRHRLCKGKRILSPMYVSVPYFDPLFNAYHYKAMDYLLPYNTNYDHLSWWHSNRAMTVKVEIIFRGQAVMFAPVYIMNKLHRPYPRDNGNPLQAWKSLVEEIEKKLPIQYRRKKFVKDLISRPDYVLDNSQTVCLNLPTHFPIVPFQHFEWTEMF